MIMSITRVNNNNREQRTKLKKTRFAKIRKISARSEINDEYNNIIIIVIV